MAVIFGWNGRLWEEVNFSRRRCRGAKMFFLKQFPDCLIVIQIDTSLENSILYCINMEHEVPLCGLTILLLFLILSPTLIIIVISFSARARSSLLCVGS